MKQNNIKSKIALGIILIISIILCAIYIQFNHQNVNTKYSDIIINNEKLNIFYFNVGQADCTLITINNKNMLIDVGQDSDGEYIIEFLKEKDINNLDYLVITHGDIDHIGGAKDIIGHIKIENIFMPQGIIECEEEYQEIKKLAIQNKIKMPKVEINQKFNLDKANFQIVSVKNDTNCKANDSSIAIRLNYIDTNYLFMGDVTSNVEEEIKCEKADILKVGHHGSSSSTSTEFLQKISPKYAVISAGNHKKYNHPSDEVIKRLKAFGINGEDIYITKNQGTIWVTSDGKNINIECRKDINLDGTGQIGQKNICNYMFFFW